MPTNSEASQLTRARFSEKNYYSMFSPVLAFLAAYGWQTGTIAILIKFAVLGVARVGGEILIGWWWHFYYRYPLWSYNTRPLFQKYTSVLNFLPWGVGGLIYIGILTRLGRAMSDNSIILIFIGALSVSLLAV